MINVVEDFVEAAKLGLGGAATATTAAEMIGKCTILGPSWKKLLSPNSKKEYGILLPYGLKDDSSQSTRAFLKFAAGPHPDLWEDRRVRGHGPRRRHTRLAPEHLSLFFVSPFLEVISQTRPSLPFTILRRPDQRQPR